MARAFKACAVVDCNGDAHASGCAQGFCKAHYRRLLRHGDPLGGGTSMGARKRWIEQHANHIGIECLNWPFSRNENGYGQFKVAGQSTLASRVMCEAAHGAPPSPTHQAAHSCGNGARGCMNPQHLRWATRVENEADKVEHGTLPRGERQGNSKLTADDVRAIRQQAETATHGVVAKRFGVARSQISRIVNGDQWGWLT